MRQLFSQLQERTLWVNQQVLLCVSEASNDAEHNQFSQLLRQVGVRKFRYVSRLMAIGTALQLPLMDPQAHCIIDIGGHTTEIGVVSCGSVVRSRQFKIGGDTFSLSLLRYLRKKYDVEISIRQADRIKEQFGSAKSTDGTEVVEIFGRSIAKSFPKIEHIPLFEIQKGIAIGIDMWISAVEGFFDELPIELSTDIAQTGVVLVGGGAQLAEIDWVLSNRLRMMVVVPEGCSELCLTGAAQAFRNEKQSGSV
jgi:rod shape-determining protein MreB